MFLFLRYTNAEKGTVTGTASVNEQTGANYFKPNANGIHKFVIKKYENDYYEEQINNLL